MRHTPKNISVVASGHVADNLDTQIEQAKAFIQEGIDAYVFISNRFASEDEDDSVFIKNIDRAVEAVGDINFGIYECPYPYKRVMTPAVLKKLAESGRFTFLKDTCCDPGMINEKLRAVDGMGLKIFNANSASLLETLKMGCAGFSGVMANFHPEIYSWLCKTLKRAGNAKKFRLFSALRLSPSARFILSTRSIICPSRACRWAVTAAQRTPPRSLSAAAWR